MEDVDTSALDNANVNTTVINTVSNQTVKDYFLLFHLSILELFMISVAVCGGPTFVVEWNGEVWLTRFLDQTWPRFLANNWLLFIKTKQP